MNLYTNLPRLVLGFHGCDKTIRDTVLNSHKKNLILSKNNYDWLGHGIYFWENDPIRALEFAKNKKVDNPSVIGAVIDLGNCLNLSERDGITALKESYDVLKIESDSLGIDMPVNKLEKNGYKMLRDLDCAVFEYLHKSLKKLCQKEYDTVISYFPEGENAYEGSGFKELNHVQICVRNTNCIKGYFLPRNI